MPFRLQDVGYDEVAARTGWLLAAYVGPFLGCFQQDAVYLYLTSRSASLSVRHDLSRIQKVFLK
jgi:hypothetical protein